MPLASMRRNTAGGSPTLTVPFVAPLDAGYKIAPMDTLSVKIFGMTDLTGDYQVDLRGNI